jgi:hypothetical protein
VADQPPPGSYPAPLPGSYPAPLPGGNPPTSDTYGPPPGAYPPPYQQAGQLPPGSVIPGQPGPPQAPAKKAMTTQRIVILSIIGVLVVGVGIWAFLQSKSATINANVGDCVQVSGSVTASNPDTEQIDCNDPKALFVVTATGDETMQCEDGETEYYQKNSKGDVTDRVCMLPNVQTGDCFVPAPTVVQLPQVGDCSTLTGSTKVKVLLVDRTTSDESKCPADKIGAYSSVARHILICFGKAP